MTALGYDPNDNSTDVTTPQGIGNVVCAAVFSGTAMVEPAQQPLQYFDAMNTFVTRGFLGAQWNLLIPRDDLRSQYESFLSANPPFIQGQTAFLTQSTDLVQISPGLTDTQKMIRRVLERRPHSETPPSHRCLHAQYLSTLYNHTRDQDVKMFFAMTNAKFGASIAAWDAKHFWNSVGPATTTPYLFSGTKMWMWGGPFKGRVWQDAGLWIPISPARSQPRHFLSSFRGTARSAVPLPRC